MILRMWSDGENIILAQKDTGVVRLGPRPYEISDPDIVTMSYSDMFGTVMAAYPGGLRVRYRPEKRVYNLEPTVFWADQAIWILDGAVFAIGSDDGYVRLWDAKTLTLLHSEKISDHWLTSCSWCEETAMLSFGTSDGEIILLHFNKDALKLDSITKHKLYSALISSMSWSKSGDRLFVTVFDGTVHERTVEDWSINLERKDTPTPWYCMRSHDDTKIAYTNANGGITVLSPQGTIILSNEFGDEYKSNDISTLSLAWNPDDKLIAGGLTTGDVVIWDVETGKILRKKQIHLDWIRDLVWSAANNLIFSAAGDYNVAVINPDNLEVIDRFSSQGIAAAISINPTGTRLVYSDSLGEVVIQDLNIRNVAEEEDDSWM